VNTRAANGTTALHMASGNGYIEIVKLLIDHGAEMDAQGRWSGDALQAASYCGDIEIVEFLIEHGADVNAQGGKYGSTFI
jgi:ankyrin repeat protein